MPITVKSGDTLWGIAQRLWGNGSYYTRLKGFKSGNPNLIYPGEVITWDGDTGAGGASAPTSTAPAGPTPEQIAAKEEEDKYNGVIADYDLLKKDWKNIIDPTDVAGNELYSKFLDTLTNNPNLDPYYAQRLADGVAGPSQEATLQELLANPTLKNALGPKWLELLGTVAANANDNELNATSAAHARAYLGQAANLENSTMTGLDEAAKTFADNGIRGGMRNAGVNEVREKGAGASANMNSGEADWRRGYKADNKTKIQGYASSQRETIKNNDWNTLWANSGINNADLRNKFLGSGGYAETNWT